MGSRLLTVISDGFLSFQVSANDLDEGSNAHVNYHIVDGNHDNAFVIEPSFSGLIKTNIVLDREIRDTYKLTIIATDEGNPQLTGTTIIRINIVDANDNQPTFPPHSAITVSEGKQKFKRSLQNICVFFHRNSLVFLSFRHRRRHRSGSRNGQ